MKLTNKLLAVSAVLFLSGCNLQGLAPSVNGSGGGSSVDSEHMQITTPGGNEIVPRSNIQNAHVKIYSTGENKEFEGGDAQSLLSSIALNNPEQDGDMGSATGEIQFQYLNSVHQEETKFLYIVSGQKGQFVEDASYPAIHYHASVWLDSHWIDH